MLFDLGAVERVDPSLRAGRSQLMRARLERELQKLVADAGGRADGSRGLARRVALGRTHRWSAPSVTIWRSRRL